ncbi:MAG: type 2 isopentenyl-diphosphate Delta-isomerase [Myxococcales bacterium]|nr:type 2 isopentenyl-diphosphate Delta-isomerase [Myxococcales bacterium]
MAPRGEIHYGSAHARTQVEEARIAMTAPTDRKADHLRLALDAGSQAARNPFEAYALAHRALPELDYDAIDLGVELLGKRLASPFLISCMTGGTPAALEINRRLAEAAESAGVALGVGSQRRALEDPARADGYRLRDLAPGIPLLANLGAVQFNYGFDIDDCRRAVDMIEGDALVLHLNALQEAIQPEGQRNFSGLLAKIEAVARGLEVPVIVKEIGCGIPLDDARRLADAGVRYLDVAGGGGTSWAWIEAERAGDSTLGALFGDWGTPTPEAIAALRGIEGVTLIASGGVRNGLDAAKAIALGGHLVGVAQPFARVASTSAEAVAAAIERFARELRIAMFCSGAGSIAALRDVKIERRGGWGTHP